MELGWNEQGLLPVIVQHVETGEVLMMAWANAEAIELTLRTGQVHFFSRSRNRLWRKGESSGHTLELVSVRADCDADVLLVTARPAGPACHTGAPSCFFQPLSESGLGPEDRRPPIDRAILERLEEILRARRADASAATSYSKSLFEGGVPKINRKIAEEQAELSAELD